jgi:hypothetical protein
MLQDQALKDKEMIVKMQEELRILMLTQKNTQAQPSGRKDETIIKLREEIIDREKAMAAAIKKEEIEVEKIKDEKNKEVAKLTD